LDSIPSSTTFQTPSAGRWVLQPPATPAKLSGFSTGFKPHQRGGGCCSSATVDLDASGRPVSNPISGEVGAAAHDYHAFDPHDVGVSNPISGEVGAAASNVCSHDGLGLYSFKPHQRGGGCCSPVATKAESLPYGSFKPHQRGGGCCSPPFISSSLFKELNTRFREPPPPGGGGSGACHRLRSAEAI
jgi:hypothetical protein